MMRRRRPLSLPVLAAAVGLGGLLARPARAEPATAQLESTNAAGAADCPDADRLARAVNDGLGRTAIVAARANGPAARVRVGVTFQRAARGYAATVRLDGARGGTRRLSNGGPGCAALANAVGVLLTVVLDNDAAASGDSAAGAAAAGAGTAGGKGVYGGRGGVNADLGFGGGVAEGLIGGWSPTLGFAGTFAFPHWAARLGGLWLPTKSNDYGLGRLDVALAAARLELCLTTTTDRSRVTLGLCAQQQIGWMHGGGFDFIGGRIDSDRLWLAAGAALVASGSFERSFGWDVEVGAVRLLQQQRFVVDTVGTAYQSDPFAFMTTLTFTTRLW